MKLTNEMFLKGIDFHLKVLIFHKKNIMGLLLMNGMKYDQ